MLMLEKGREHFLFPATLSGSITDNEIFDLRSATPSGSRIHLRHLRHLRIKNNQQRRSRLT